MKPVQEFWHGSHPVPAGGISRFGGSSPSAPTILSDRAGLQVRSLLSGANGTERTGLKTPAKPARAGQRDQRLLTTQGLSGVLQRTSHLYQTLTGR
jgi:hypothetical protein